MSVTKHNLAQYLLRLMAYKIHEFDAVAAAVRHGLLTQIPVSVIYVLPWQR